MAVVRILRWLDAGSSIRPFIWSIGPFIDPFIGPFDHSFVHSLAPSFAAQLKSAQL